jgi:hypothetical protein
MNFRLLLPLLALFLTACDIPGLGPDPRIALREAEARAAGSACRFAIRGIEDCYELNDKTSKAAIFAGWKEMDQYMRENNVEGIPYNKTPKEEIIQEKQTASAEDDKHTKEKSRPGNKS